MTSRSTSRPQAASPWLVLGFGTLITFVTLGMRHAFGFFLEPVTSELPGVDRDSFGLAIALQNLVWGLSQPFAGMIADRYGSARVLFLGGLCYAGGLLVAAFSTGPVGLYIGFGGLIGIGLGCATFAVVLGAVGRVFPDERRSSVLGIATLGGATGMFFAVPLTLGLLTWLGWQGTLLALAGMGLLVCLAAPFLIGRSEGSASQQSLSEALREALPLTSGVVARLFGVRYLATLVGVVFFMHQVGGFLGAWIGGLVFEASGSYDLVWWTMVVATALAALIHLAID